MKRFKSLIITGVALVILAVLAGCASMQIVGLEETATGPKQVRQYRDIDPKDITVNGTYKDGSTKRVSLSRSDFTFDSSKAGTQTVTIKKSGFTASFQTEVMALTRITVVSQPQALKLGNSYNLTNMPGLEIQAEWDQMGSEKIFAIDCEYTGLDMNRSGSQNVAITYKGMQTTFNVNVVAMESMRIASNPSKVTYTQGDPLVLTGLKVMGTWTGLPEEEISITAADITGYNANTVGRQTLTVTKNGKTATFTVDVASNPHLALNGSWANGTNVYTFNNGNWEQVMGSTVFGKGTYTISGSNIIIQIAQMTSVFNGERSLRTKAEMVEMKIWSQEEADDLFAQRTWKYSISGNTLTLTLEGQNPVAFTKK
jgi:hypothetical protein